MSDKVTLSNEELIERCDKWILDLCKDRKNWTLSVPVQFNRDPDMLFTELIRRFKEALHPCESAGMPENNIQEFYKEWCKETKRSGGVLIGSSIKELLADFAKKIANPGVSAVWVKASERLPKPFKVVPCKWTPDSHDPRKDTELHWGFVSKEGNWDQRWPHYQVEWLDESAAAAQSGKEDAVEINLTAAIAEGAECWKMEYDMCRKLLQELVDLKKIKDTEGKSEDYSIRQPIAWKAAIKFLEKYQHINW